MKVLPAKIKSVNAKQKYPHIIELSASILNIFAFMFFMSNKPFYFFRNMFNFKTVKLNNFNIFYMQSNSMCTNVYIFIKTSSMSPIFYCFRQIISRVNISVNISKFVRGCGIEFFFISIDLLVYFLTKYLTTFLKIRLYVLLFHF